MSFYQESYHLFAFQQVNSTEDILIEINVTETKEGSLVNIQISGGSEALKLRSILGKLDYLQKE